MRHGSGDQLRVLSTKGRKIPTNETRILLTQQDATISKTRPTAPAIAMRIMASVDSFPESNNVTCFAELPPTKSTSMTCKCNETNSNVKEDAAYVFF